MIRSRPLSRPVVIVGEGVPGLCDIMSFTMRHGDIILTEDARDGFSGYAFEAGSGSIFLENTV